MTPEMFLAIVYNKMCQQEPTTASGGKHVVIGEGMIGTTAPYGPEDLASSNIGKAVAAAFADFVDANCG